NGIIIEAHAATRLRPGTSSSATPSGYWNIQMYIKERVILRDWAKKAPRMREMAALEGRPGWGVWDAVWDTCDFANHYSRERKKYKYYINLIKKEEGQGSISSGSRSRLSSAQINRANKGKGRATTADEEGHAYSWIPDPVSEHEEDDGGFSLDEAEWADRARRSCVIVRIPRSLPAESIAERSYSKFKSEPRNDSDIGHEQKLASSHAELVNEKSFEQLEVHKPKGTQLRTLVRPAAAAEMDVIYISSDDDDIPTLATQVARSSLAPKSEVVEITDSLSENQDEFMHDVTDSEGPRMVRSKTRMTTKYHIIDGGQVYREKPWLMRRPLPTPDLQPVTGSPLADEVPDSQDDAEDFNSSDSETKYTQRPPRSPSPDTERTKMLIELNRQILEFAPVSFLLVDPLFGK
ncbi:hypothetical protein RHS01_05841, partial [Rhizoctonia solani]